MGNLMQNYNFYIFLAKLPTEMVLSVPLQTVLKSLNRVSDVHY